MSNLLSAARETVGAWDRGTIVLLVLAALVVERVVRYYSKLRTVGYVKSVISLFEPYNLPGALIPATWWNAGTLFTWTRRHTLYRDNKADTISIVPLLFGKPYIYSSSMEVLKQCTAHRAPFDKTDMGTRGLLIFGPNIVASMRDQWPRHRRIVNPAFNQHLYQQVWAQSVSTFHDMTSSEGWDMRDAITIPDIQRLVGKFALFIITAVGFGIPLPWREPPGSEKENENENEMTLLEAFSTMTDNMLISMAAPKWAYKLPIKVLHQTKASHQKILSVMTNMIASRRTSRPSLSPSPSSLSPSSNPSPPQDVFSILLRANESEPSSEKTKLSDSELISNTFVMLFAGHETSAKTMSSALGLLACNPDEQEKLYQHILAVMPGGRDPAFEDFDALRPVQACLLEALRLFPTAAVIIRQALEDVILRTEADSKPLAISKGAIIIGDVTGINYNPRYYPNPNAFIPSRWLGASPTHELGTGDYVAFGAGPRVCIGRKFALFEMTCFLALFLRDWRVEPEGMRAGEDLTGWRRRVLEGTVTLTITMGPGVVPLKLTRRA